MVLRFASTALICATAACATPNAIALDPSDRAMLELVRPDGAVSLRRILEQSPVTVLVFFSTHCHCLDSHESRLRSLYAEYSARGVQFFMIDSEVGGSRERDDREAQARGYPFPILLDRGARLADSVGADFATYAVVFDARGHVAYRGGIDSDQIVLHERAALYVKDALDDLLAGRRPRVATGKTLGCTLEKW